MGAPLHAGSSETACLPKMHPSQHPRGSGESRHPSPGAVVSNDGRQEGMSWHTSCSPFGDDWTDVFRVVPASLVSGPPAPYPTVRTWTEDEDVPCMKSSTR